MNLETKITIYKFTPQVFTLTPQGTTSVQAGGNFRVGVEHVSFRPQTKVVAL